MAAQIYPDGTVAPRAPSRRVVIAAMAVALLVGAGAAVGIYALVDDNPVTVITRTVDVPTSSLAGTTEATTAKTDAAAHAQTLRGIGAARDNAAAAATGAGTAAKHEDATAAALAQEQYYSSYGGSDGTAAKHEDTTAALIGR
jgi:hypothetical protein